MPLSDEPRLSSSAAIGFDIYHFASPADQQHHSFVSGIFRESQRVTRFPYLRMARLNASTYSHQEQ